MGIPLKMLANAYSNFLVHGDAGPLCELYEKGEPVEKETIRRDVSLLQLMEPFEDELKKRQESTCKGCGKITKDLAYGKCIDCTLGPSPEPTKRRKKS